MSLALSLSLRLVAERVFGEECTEKGWLLDGFPRTKEQAELLKNAGVVPDKFIILEVGVTVTARVLSCLSYC